jgi:hypothetical protein
MQKEPKPDDFDWVSARQQCTTAEAFARLSAQAKRDVETMKTISEGRVRSPFEYSAVEAGVFAIAESRIRRSEQWRPLLSSDESNPD